MDDVRARAQKLIAEIRRASLYRERMVRDGEPTTELDAALSDLHRRLGALVASAPELAGAPALAAASPAAGADEPPAGRDHGWYEDDRTGVPEDDGPLFDSDDDLRTGEIPLPDDLHLPQESDDTDVGSQYAVETAQTARVRALDPRSGLGRFQSGTAPFAPAVREFLQLVRSPLGLDAPADLASAATRVQWAATEYGARAGDLPSDVKVALIGYLAALAQHLRTRADADVGLRLALDRLQRSRSEEELPIVHGLLPTPMPEGGAWLDDAEAWWRVLHGNARS